MAARKGKASNNGKAVWCILCSTTSASGQIDERVIAVGLTMTEAINGASAMSKIFAQPMYQAMSARFGIGSDLDSAFGRMAR